MDIIFCHGKDTCSMCSEEYHRGLFENSWHRGEPTNEGEYIIVLKRGDYQYPHSPLKNIYNYDLMNKCFIYEDIKIKLEDVEQWLKIPKVNPYY